MIKISKQGMDTKYYHNPACDNAFRIFLLTTGTLNLISKTDIKLYYSQLIELFFNFKGNANIG